MAETDSKGARRTVRAGVAAGLAAIGAAFALLGCRSTSKAALRDALLALPKNARVAAVGLSETPFRADIGDGERDYELTYLRVGPKEGAAPGRVPVVIVPGTPDTLFAWTEVVFGGADHPGLAAEREVVVLEVIGHGVARGTVDGATFRHGALFVDAAVRTLGFERVHLVGNSYGGEFAWRAAVDAQDRYASVTLVDSSGVPRRDGDFLPEEVLMRENSLAKIGWVLNSAERIEAALAPHFDTIPEGRVEEVRLVCSNRENWHTMVELARDEEGDRVGDLSKLFVPTLLVWGEDDVAYDPGHYATRFAEELPLSTLVIAPDTGHYPHEQRTAWFAREVERFWTSVETGP